MNRMAKTNTSSITYTENLTLTSLNWILTHYQRIPHLCTSENKVLILWACALRIMLISVYL